MKQDMEHETEIYTLDTGEQTLKPGPHEMVAVRGKDGEMYYHIYPFNPDFPELMSFHEFVEVSKRRSYIERKKALDHSLDEYSLDNEKDIIDIKTYRRKDSN